MERSVIFKPVTSNLTKSTCLSCFSENKLKLENTWVFNPNSMIITSLILELNSPLNHGNEFSLFWHSRMEVSTSSPTQARACLIIITRSTPPHREHITLASSRNNIRGPTGGSREGLMRCLICPSLIGSRRSISSSASKTPRPTPTP